MRNKLFSALVILFFITNTHAQDCITLLNKSRKENDSLASSLNALELSNSKIVRQLQIKQDSIIVLTQKITTLEKEIRYLKLKLDTYKNKLEKKNIEIGRLREKERKLQEDLKKKTIMTDQEQATVLFELRKTKKDLELVTKDLEKEKELNVSLSELIKEKDYNLLLNDKVLQTYASKSKDYIHAQEQEVRFNDTVYKYKEVLFVLKFNEGEREYIPSIEEKEKIERLVELVSRYDTKVKIQMIIGSKKDDQKFRDARAESVKKVFYSFDEPFNLNDYNFSNRLKNTTENYDVAILIVKR